MKTFDFLAELPPLAIPLLSVLVNTCVSSRKDFNLKLFYFSMCGVAHSFSWFLLRVTGFSTGVFVRHFHANIKSGGRKSISVYVCLTLWQVVDLWTAGSVAGINLWSLRTKQRVGGGVGGGVT